MRRQNRMSVRIATLTLGAGMAVAGLAAPAGADSRPETPGVPTTVSADSLPTVQIDGVVWDQAIVGDTVYVAGNFSTARPAGAPAGVSTTPRSNLLAYDINTGELITTWAPTTNAQVLAITPSPDGTRLYIGGSFTQVNGASVWRIAALDRATGNLVQTFLPRPDATVRAVEVTTDAVYFGGLFNAVGTEVRQRLAAADPATGALLAWAPAAAGASGVNALAVSPDGSRVVVAGSFTTLNGSSRPGLGLGAVDAVSGELLPFAANEIIRNGGTNASIQHLSGDADLVFGSGYHFGQGGTLEGTFAARWETGEIVWVEDCNGDTHAAYPIGDVIYQASHKHYCGTIDAYPQTEPWTEYRATAVSREVRGTIRRQPYNYTNFEGQPRPEQLNWYPQMDTGVFTGLNQGPFTVTGDERFVLMGGEFRNVNGSTQQGLARYAVPATAPNDVGPAQTGGRFDLSGTSLRSGEVRLRWSANFDYDNAHLTYTLIRNSNQAAPIHQVVQRSTFYDRPGMGFVDTNVTPGVSYRYRLRATDPWGNIAWSDSIDVVASGTTTQGSAYVDDVLADRPSAYWRMSEPDGSTLVDAGGWNDAAVRGSVTRGVPGPLPGETATRFAGTSSSYTSTEAFVSGPDTVTLEAWFRTTTTRGGKIVGFDSARTGEGRAVDRHVYMDNGGRVYFGVRPSGGTRRTINTTQALNDGEWHHVVASLGESGMQLYVDGVRIGTRTDATVGQYYAGYWRVGGGSLANWASRPTSDYFAGDISHVALYPTVLPHERVISHFVSADRSSPVPEPPADAYGSAVHSASPELYWRLGEAGGAVANDSGFYQNPGTYRGGSTRGVDGALAGVTDTAVTFDGTSGFVASNRQFANPRVYAQELWFRTTTTNGGKLIGFGSSQTGLSSNYDRHVYMETDGRLTFGVWTGSANTITSPGRYNDGEWHHLVTTQSSDGMRMYVDGALVGTHPQTQAQAYNGYWRVGADRTWGPQPYFAGTIDEVAVYNRVLTAQEVADHHRIGRGVANEAPRASFVGTAAGLEIQVDGSASSDPDGTVTSWTWDFGDGSAPVTGATATHTYASGGEYAVTLTVTDDRGLTATETRTYVVTALPPTNEPPVAAFTQGVEFLSVALDGSSSTDPDGAVAAWRWDLGDGTQQEGRTVSHTYASSGSYTVTLTVTDDDGATASVSEQVEVTDPPAGLLVADAFDRSIASGWGSADLGGAWSTVGAVSRFSVGEGTGRMTIPSAGQGLSAFLPQVSTTETDVAVTVTTGRPPVGGAVFLSLAARRVGTADYRGKVRLGPDGAVTLQLSRLAGSETTLGTTAVPGLTVAQGDALRIRVQALGAEPTTLRAKVWKVGQAEPDDWQLTRTDTTAELQQAGSVGTVVHVASSVTNTPLVVSWDDLVAAGPGATPPPANQLPVAVFSAVVDGQSVALDGSGSSDPDGSITEYTWDFGDGSPPVSGPTASTTYAAPGTYTVTLTVRDDEGATASTTQEITVSSTPPVGVLAQDRFEREVTSGWGTAEVGGPWSLLGASTRFSVSQGAGRMTVPTPGAGLTALLPEVAARDADVSVRVTTDKVVDGSGTFVSLLARRVGSTDYRVKARLTPDGRVLLYLGRLAGSETTLASAFVPGLTHGQGDALRLRLEVSGSSPTTLRGKAWKDGTPEPADWLLTATDDTVGLQEAGAVGLSVYVAASATNAPVVHSWDDFLVSPGAAGGAG